MGRMIPYKANNPLNHSAFSLSFLVAGIAAIIAIVAVLCGTRSRKKITRTLSSVTPPSCTPEKIHSVTTTMTTNVEKSKETKTKEKSKETKTKVEEEQAPSPPKSKEMDTSINELWSKVHNTTTPSTVSTMPRKKLLVSLSMKLPGGLSMNRTRREERQQKEQDEKRKMTMRSEDSVWMKTIILGEKCRIPNGDDDILYDDKGKRVSAYHPRTPRSLPASRTNSYIDPNALPF